MGKTVGIVVSVIVLLHCFVQCYLAFGSGTEKTILSINPYFEPIFFLDDPWLSKADKTVAPTLHVWVENEGDGQWLELSSEIEKQRLLNARHWNRELKRQWVNGFLSSYNGQALDDELWQRTRGHSQAIRIIHEMYPGVNEVGLKLEMKSKSQKREFPLGTFILTNSIDK